MDQCLPAKVDCWSTSLCRSHLRQLLHTALSVTGQDDTDHLRRGVNAVNRAGRRRVEEVRVPGSRLILEPRLSAADRRIGSHHCEVIGAVAIDVDEETARAVVAAPPATMCPAPKQPQNTRSEYGRQSLGAPGRRSSITPSAAKR